MPASSTRGAISSSSTAPRTSGKLADGTPFAPQFIENKLKFSPFIREAVAFGDQQPFVAAMIAIDMQHGRQLGGAAGALPTPATWTSASKPEVGAPDRRGDRQGQRHACPTCSRSGAILLLNKELEADDAEMTRTRKVRRALRGREVRAA